jgi:hypothetical protein
LKGGKDNIAMSVSTTTTGNSIKLIHILFRAFSIELKREDEKNMIPIVPCPIKIKGRNFIKRVASPIMPKPRMTLLQRGEDDKHMAP